MTFHSILFESPGCRPPGETVARPDFFIDLNLDQIVAAITAGREEYNLTPLFHWPLRDADEVLYRHEIMRDLENAGLLADINAFAQTMRAMRDTLKQAEKRYYRRQKDALFVDAVDAYCDAIASLQRDLAATDLRSRGLLSFRDYLTDYANSDRFASLLAEAKKLRADLSTVKYTLQIKGGSITVRKYDSEIDYAADVDGTFRRFQQGAVKDYRAAFIESPQMNHVEAAIMEFVARLHSDIFVRVNEFCRRCARYLDESIGRFDREIHFYIAYLDHIRPFRRAGLSFCYPTLSSENKELCVHDAFDLALANALVANRTAIVCNDFFLKGQERIFVVSGPNNGGKTTFARMFGQLHYLASLGCLVPGRRAQLFLFDQILTHFEREEDISNLRGKLQDDLVRIYDTLNRATAQSLIIVNEIFNSGTLQDAIFLATKVLERVVQIDALCVCVSFIDELTLISYSIVSASSTIVPERPAVRTYKIVRKPAEGLAYAMSIAEKYGLTRRQIRERIRS